MRSGRPGVMKRGSPASLASHAGGGYAPLERWTLCTCSAREVRANAQLQAIESRRKSPLPRVGSDAAEACILQPDNAEIWKFCLRLVRRRSRRRSGAWIHRQTISCPCERETALRMTLNGLQAHAGRRRISSSRCVEGGALGRPRRKLHAQPQESPRWHRPKPGANQAQIARYRRSAKV